MALRGLTAFALCGLTTFAHADAGVELRSDEWNGLSALVEIAGADGALEMPPKVEIASLSADDSLLMIHPTTELPTREITAFLRRGGRVAIADDQGSGDRLLEAFEITREHHGSPSLRLRDNPHLLIAQPSGAHPLTYAVRAVVTNHPVTLRHAELEPVFTFGDGGTLMLAGAVGEGRLIAIADSSLFINNMMMLEGNRQLARNLVQYLREGRPGRLLLVTGATPLTSRISDRFTAPVDGLRSLLTRISNVALPRPLVAFATWMLCVFAFVLAASHSQLRSPYTRMTLFTRTPTIAGFAGRVAFFRKHSRNLVQPTLAFKVELEAALLNRLGAGKGLLLGEMIDDLGRRGANNDVIAGTRQLLFELDEIATQEERGVEPPIVRAEKFRDLVSRGERILADIARLG